MQVFPAFGPAGSFHVIAVPEGVRTPPSISKVVSDLAPDGTFREIAELGHVSMVRHGPDIVAASLRDILDRAGG